MAISYGRRISEKGFWLRFIVKEKDLTVPSVDSSWTTSVRYLANCFFLGTVLTWRSKKKESEFQKA